MKILTFDPGLKKIGWAFVEKLNESYLSIIATGKFVYKKSDVEIPKLIEVYKPDCVGYELTGKFLNSIYSTIISEATITASIPAIGCKVQTIRDDVYNDSEMSKADTNEILKNQILNLKNGISKDELDAISVALFLLDTKPSD